MKALLDTVLSRPFIEALVTCCSLVGTLLVTRTNRWLRALLEHERIASEKQIADIHERELRRSNETLRILSQASEPAEPPTLESLLGDERQDFSLESSATRSFPWPKQNPATLPGLGRLTPTSKASGQHRATDWSGDDEITAPAPISSYPPPEPQGNKP